jgi:hypothetical protein
MRIRLRTSVGTLCLLITSQAAAQQDGFPGERRLLRPGLDIGFTAVDGRQIVNASALMLRLGGELATAGRVYGFVGAQGMMPVPPVSGSGGEFVRDGAGNPGLHSAGNMSLGYLRAGVGTRVSLAGRELSLRGTAARGLDGDRTPWLSTAARVPLWRTVSLEAEAGWNRNWIRDTYFRENSFHSDAWEVLYVDRFEGWLPTVHLGIRMDR